MQLKFRLIDDRKFFRIRLFLLIFICFLRLQQVHRQQREKKLTRYIKLFRNSLNASSSYDLWIAIKISLNAFASESREFNNPKAWNETKFFWAVESFRCRRLLALLDTLEKFERETISNSLLGDNHKWCQLGRKWKIFVTKVSSALTCHHQKNHWKAFESIFISFMIEPNFREKLLLLSLNSPAFDWISIVLHRWLLFWTLDGLTQPRMNSLTVLISCWEVA